MKHQSLTVDKPVLARPSKRKARIRMRATGDFKSKASSNRREMSVPVTETFEHIHAMNKKALSLLAKRA